MGPLKPHQSDIKDFQCRTYEYFILMLINFLFNSYAFSYDMQLINQVLYLTTLGPFLSL